MKSILVLCEGNHCRSPIAEALLRASLGPGFRVGSAGLNALVDLPADPEAQRLAAGLGIDLSRHRGRQWTEAMSLSSDLILVMDEFQKAWCEETVPSSRGRVFLLGHWLPKGPRPIPDPFRQGPEAFRKAFDMINHSVAGWLPRLITKQRTA